MAKINITKDLINDLKKYGEQMSVGMATVIRDELVETTRSAIEEFYNNYSPISYKRHYYNFRENSYKPFYKNPHGSIIRGGVELTPYEMDDIYQQEPQDVFSYFYAGYHGMIGSFLNGDNKDIRIPKMNPSPLEIIELKRENIIKNISKYSNFGYNRANKKSYSTFI